MEKERIAILSAAVVAVIVALAITYLTDTQAEEGTDYSDPYNWAYYGLGDGKPVDVFLIAPTVDTQDEYNMSISDEGQRARFYGALEMERHLYGDSARLFAPYYRQCSMKMFDIEPSERVQYEEIAYSDISDAFRYYLKNEASDRPMILAGFSQGAQMCYMLLEEYFGNKALYDRLVAVYALGWPCTEDMVSKYPQIRPAQSSTDTGVVITFDCEAPEITDTAIVPEGTWTYSINPLNWKTDGTVADSSENMGACIMRSNGDIKAEIPNFCGAYIDAERGTLKATGVDPDTYKPVVSFLPSGAYHIYDFEFFFENLKQNLDDRIAAFLGAS